MHPSYLGPERHTHTLQSHDVLPCITTFLLFFFYFKSSAPQEGNAAEGEGGSPAEQKTIGDMIDEENDFDKENEFLPQERGI